MSVQQQIETRLTDSLEPEVLQVRNESFMHNVPEGSRPSRSLRERPVQFCARCAAIKWSTRFSVRCFRARPLPCTLQSEEWQSSPDAPDSPKCHGGEK